MLYKRRIEFGWPGLALLAAACLFGVGGCSENQSAEREQSNLKPLAVFYGQYLGQHRGQPPADEQDFKKFLYAMGKERLEAMQVKNVDELFVSPRDRKPYVVLYGPVPKTGAELPSTTVIAYEQVGKGGNVLLPGCWEPWKSSTRNNLNNWRREQNNVFRREAVKELQRERTERGHLSRRGRRTSHP